MEEMRKTGNKSFGDSGWEQKHLAISEVISFASSPTFHLAALFGM